jgi:hypothetical protein
VASGPAQEQNGTRRVGATGGLPHDRKQVRCVRPQATLYVSSILLYRVGATGGLPHDRKQVCCVRPQATLYVSSILLYRVGATGGLPMTGSTCVV